ncbi:MAG: sigma-70 family RNA polymerase sigma factor [Chloroflexi bacterium]|nr:sigma-70 family RNA polymerase sigma factor [Chloroflexota bacterium]
MARPVFRNAGAAQTAAPRIAHLDLDRPLVDAALREPGRFEALYRRYVAQVYSFAYYELGDHHAAEDATARTFLSALTNLSQFEERARPEDGDGASTFKVWLFQIARNGIANERRSSRRHPAVVLDDPAAAIIADPLNVEADAVRRDEAASAWRAVGRLPGDRRRALVLRFVNELSTAEIAGVMGRSEGAVRVLLHRGLRGVARDLVDGADGTDRRRARGGT